MACSLANEPDVKSFQACGAVAMGLYGYPGPTIPDDTQYTRAAVNSSPGGAPAGYAMLAEACLRARGLIYFKVTPGDCGSPVSAPGSAVPGLQIVGLSGAAASGVIGGLGAAGAIAAPVVSSVVPVIGGLISAIEGIFAEHAAAVKNEQTTLCQVAQYFNQIIRQIDNGVASGVLSPAQGITYLTQAGNQAQMGLDSIAKTCNAACVYSAIIQAHMNFAKYFYNVIGPAGAANNAPGAAPSIYGGSPGGVLATNLTPPPPAPIRSTPGNTYAPAIVGRAPNIGPPPVLGFYNQSTGQSAQATDVPGTTNWFLIIGFVVVLGFIIVAVARK